MINLFLKLKIILRFSSKPPHKCSSFALTIYEPNSGITLIREALHCFFP